MATPKILTAGEALIDWVSCDRGVSLPAATAFTRAPGGAPLNVAIGLARLGHDVGYAGCLADDVFGEELARLVKSERLEDACVRRVPGRQTRMAYIVTQADGERELAAFGRGPCADAELCERDLPDAMLRKLEGFYFGSLSLTGAASRSALLEAAARVRASGGLVFFDPNVRMVLWPDPTKLLRVLRAAMEVSHVVKLGGEELAALTGTYDLAPGADRLLSVHPLAAVIVTYGAKGSGIRVRGGVTLSVPGLAVPSQDVTGAGDGFVAGLLASLVEACQPPERLPDTLSRLDEAGWASALGRANAVGALVTTRVGAIAALPHRDELEAFLAMRS